MKIVIVGAGNMGSGIAQKYATEGYEVLLMDLSEEALNKGKGRILQMLDDAVERRLFTGQKKEKILQNIGFTTQLEEAKDSDFVIEAVFEDKQVKKQLFTQLDDMCQPSTVFATNTSSFFVTDLAKATGRQDRFVGLHYFYHPAKNKLVEVIKGQATAHETFQKAWLLQEAIGKIPIASMDSPGFMVNRFFVPWLNEAMRLVQEKVANIPTLEAACKKIFGVPLGPFELMNVTGLPITYHSAQTLAEELGTFYAPCSLIQPLIKKNSHWNLEGPIEQEAFQTIEERLCGVVFYVASQLVFNEKVGSLEDCDLGARVGLRWPKGPFEMMNEKGISTSFSLIKQFTSKYPELANPSLSTEKGQWEQPFTIHAVNRRVENQVGIITFNRPDTLNALDENVFAQLESCFIELENNSEVKGIVIEARGKAFVAGADIHFFVEQLRHHNLSKIEEFTRLGQKVLRRIDVCSKAVVCKLNGLALGGGLELALACDYIIAAEQAAMGFPETGIGIYPGLGGTQRTPRRVGTELARWLVLSGEIIKAKTALALGLIDDVVSLAALSEQAHKAALSLPPRKENALPRAVPEPFSLLAQTFKMNLPELLSAEPPSDREDIKQALQLLHKKAPLALRKADELVRKAQLLTLEEGLLFEYQEVREIFATEDALTGLSSVGKGRPVFRGI